MKRIIRIIFWLNLDTALGTAITSLFIANYLEVEVEWTSILALAIALLVIYNFDHIIDVKKLANKNLSSRYQFYSDNLKIIIGYEIVLLFILLILALKVPNHIIVRGAVLGGFTSAYFLFLFLLLPKRFVVKELIIAVVFTLGVFLAPVSTLELAILDKEILILAFQIFLLALVNTFVFAWYEYESDHLYGHTSIALVLGKKTLFILSIVSLIIFLISLFISLTMGISWVYIMTLEIMGSILFLSLVFSRYLANDGLYRIVVESIFLVPIIVLLFVS